MHPFHLPTFRCEKCNCWTWLVEKCCISSIFSKKRSCIGWMMRFERRCCCLFSPHLDRMASDSSSVISRRMNGKMYWNQVFNLLNSKRSSSRRRLKSWRMSVSLSHRREYSSLSLLTSKCFDCKLASHLKIDRSTSTI